jgi:adenylylsulfate kinase
MNSGIVIWITGLPASGKSTIARAFLSTFRKKYKSPIVHLNSDHLRSVLTPNPTYSFSEREWFYSVIAFLAGLLHESGVHVLIDATGNRRKFRDEVRKAIPAFLEVYIKCPLSVCIERDPKGIYRKGKIGKATSVPGLQEPYEESDTPEVVIESDKIPSGEAADNILRKLNSYGWLS